MKPDPTLFAPPAETVGQLTQRIKECLEAGFSEVNVIGEISGLSIAASGHCYFTLKDETAALRCVLWRRQAAAFARLLAEGHSVEAAGELSVYAPRGDYQLVVRGLKPAGAGLLWQRFLAVKAKLEAEGLFAAERKRPLPRRPRRLALITSPAGDAIHDVLRTLRQRAPLVEVVLLPTLVQGAEAPAQLVAALARLAEVAPRLGIEAALLVRGGGSPEDLMAYNDEALARAIAASSVPIVSGVGHEADVSIADLVADVRAPTPTGAAVIVSQGWTELPHELDLLAQRLQRALRERLLTENQRLDRLQLRLTHPAARLSEARRRLEALHARLTAAQRRTLAESRLRLDAFHRRLAGARPTLAGHHARLDAFAQRLPRAAAQALEAPRRRLERLEDRLQALDPKAVLARGYALVSDAGGQVLTSAAQLAPGQDIRLEFHDGRAAAEVVGVEKSD
ncbi:MAG: exodeoxyribonuclease VII large subunit [Rhodocyclales bacterium]|nr:exodeoxyribonuclease VII large subunit [Rhodocyclales bacterium]